MCIVVSQLYNNGISTILGYLMPNPLYAYILNMICKQMVCRLPYLRIRLNSFVYEQLNGSNTCYEIIIIQFSINNCFFLTATWCQVYKIIDPWMSL